MTKWTHLAWMGVLFVTPAALPQAADSTHNVVTRLPSYVQLPRPRAQVPARKVLEAVPPTRGEVSRPRCAHMIIKRVDPKTDPGMVVEPPADGKMPIFRGVPGCPEDVRP